MKARITSIAESAGGIRVIFETECGIGTAIWASSRPDKGKDYFVEISTDIEVQVGKTLVSAEEKMGVYLDGNNTVLVGGLTDVDNDGYARLDFGCGCLDLEYAGRAPVAGQRYKLIVPDLMMYDMAY